jgi:hypothetical protein
VYDNVGLMYICIYVCICGLVCVCVGVGEIGED